MYTKQQRPRLFCGIKFGYYKDSDAFDSTYMHMMVAGHDQAIALHNDEIENGLNTAIKQYAEDKLEVIKLHRMRADSLAHALYP